VSEPGPSSDHAAVSARVAAEALRAGGMLAIVSALLLAAALALAVGTPGPRRACLLASALAGLGQTYWAMRTRLDAGIFAFWSERWARGGDPEADMSAFDMALGRHATSAQRSSSHARPLRERIEGALRLLRNQAIACASQAGLLAAAALWPIE